MLVRLNAVEAVYSINVLWWHCNINVVETLVVQIQELMTTCQYYKTVIVRVHLNHGRPDILAVIDDLLDFAVPREVICG